MQQMKTLLLFLLLSLFFSDPNQQEVVKECWNWCAFDELEKISKKVTKSLNATDPDLHDSVCGLSSFKEVLYHTMHSNISWREISFFSDKSDKSFLAMVNSNYTESTPECNSLTLDITGVQSCT